MSLQSRFLLNLLLSVGSIVNCTSQYVEDATIINCMEKKIERILHHKYEVLIFDVNKSLSHTTPINGIFIDPYGTLSNSYIFLTDAIRDSNFVKPKGFIGICRADSIIWTSDLLTENFSSLSADISNICELNRDGRVEIVISQYSQSDGTWEYLWIFSWDGKNGKLITKLDDEGESTMKCRGNYLLNDIDGDGIYEIQGKDPDSKKNVTFSWNGHLYGKWGKTSKYFLKGKKK